MPASAASAFRWHETEAPIAGRRVAVHEYPGRDEPFVEDLGRRTKRWTVEAFVVGDDYAAIRDRLIDACDMPGAGELVHPYLGSLQVACTACSLTERTREGRMARLSLEFVEAGANQYPTNNRRQQQRDATPSRRRREPSGARVSPVDDVPTAVVVSGRPDRKSSSKEAWGL